MILALWLACGPAAAPPANDEVLFLGVPAKDDRPAYEVSIVLPKGTTERIPAEKWMLPVLHGLQGPVDTCWADDTMKLPAWELLATLRLDGQGGMRLVTVEAGDSLSKCVIERFEAQTPSGAPAEKLDVPFGVRFQAASGAEAPKAP